MVPPVFHLQYLNYPSRARYDRYRINAKRFGEYPQISFHYRKTSKRAQMLAVKEFENMTGRKIRPLINL